MRKLLVILLLVGLALVAVPQIVLAGNHNNALRLIGNVQDDHSGQADGAIASFHLRLTGSQQFPVVNTTSFGRARLQLVDNNTLLFTLVVCNIANVTHAHIHVGAVGVNGPIVVPLFDEPTFPFTVSHGCAVLAAGVRTPSDLLPQSGAGINTWNDFLNALLHNNTYINVHTSAHPSGEIRGQLIVRADNDHHSIHSAHFEHEGAEDKDDE